MMPNMLRSAAVLGLLSAVGPFAIDMYLPALPDMATDLGSTPAATQATLTAFFIAFGLAQLIYGPWADQAGRKPPLYVGLSIFIVGSVGCFFAPSIGWLVACRFLQGLGGSVVMVVPRAIIRDLHTGEAATRLMALVMLVISVSPMLAPLLGSAVMAIAGWRWIFMVLGIAALLSLAMTRMMLPETLAPEHRVPIRLGTLRTGAKRLLTSRSFLSLTFVGGFSMGSFFVFIASAAFVYSGQYGLTPVKFSLAFAANAIGFFAASQFAAPLGARIGMGNMVSKACLGFVVIMLVLVALDAAHDLHLFLLIGLLMTANACLGLVVPTVMVMALDDHGEIAGLASSLGGTLQMITAGMMILVTAPFFDGTSLPMVTAIAACGILALIMARIALRAPANPAKI